MEHKPIQGPFVWYASQFEDQSSWVYQFTEQDISVFEDALAHFRRLQAENPNIGLGDITKDLFPLSKELADRLQQVQNDVVWGRGFILFRGLPVHKYPLEDVAIIYLGMGAYMGDVVSQNAKGHLLGHVRDLGNDPKNPLTRLYTTHERQRFHTDSCDIVGLLCLQPSKEGGLSSICSSASVYNEMLQNRPDLFKELVTPMCWDRKGEIPPGKLPYWHQPIFNFAGDHMSVFYDRNFLISTKRFEPEVPYLTDHQIEALDYMENLCASDKLRLDMVLRPGDIQFIHNHHILHARTSFIDFDEETKKRHLLRLWLSAPNGRPLPEVFSERYGNIAVGTKRGGIVVPNQKLYFPLNPFT